MARAQAMGVVRPLFTADQVVPPSIDFRTPAAMLLMKIVPVPPGSTAMVWTAAGLGPMLVQAAPLCCASSVIGNSSMPISGFKPANNELGSSVRQSAQDPMNTHSFFFSFDSVLPGEASKPASGGLPSWGRPSLKKTLAVPVFIVQNDRAWS